MNSTPAISNARPYNLKGGSARLTSAGFKLVDGDDADTRLLRQFLRASCK
jgi:hypothetical protein